MQKQEIELLLNDIRTDNLKSFRERMKKCVYNISLGRFPLLTLMYMYDSRKLLLFYKKKLHKMSKYESVTEPLSIQADFRKIAKRTLRLYQDNEIITPYEILAIKGYTEEFDKYYISGKVNGIQRGKIVKINAIFTGEKISDSRGRIVLTKRKLTGFRKQLVTASIIILCVTILFATATTIYSVVLENDLKTNGIAINNANIFSTAISSDSDSEYYISDDFTINMAKWKSAELKKNLDGKNHTITLTNVDKPLFTELNVTLNNLNFIVKGNISSELIETLSSKGKLNNCKFIYKDISVICNDNFSLIVMRNNGEISDIEIDISGEFVAENDENNNTNTKYIQILTYENTGTIQNVTLSENLTISGSSGSNYEFSSICGKNMRTISFPYYYYAVIKNIKIKDSSLKTSLIDIAGICADNAGHILSCDIELDITDNCTSETWNPNITSVCLRNNYNISGVNVNGDITVTSDSSQGAIFTGGIVIYNYYAISECTYNGNIILKNKTYNESYILCGGISVYNYYSMYKCKFTGGINIEGTGQGIYAGGITAYNTYNIYNGIIEKSISDGTMTINTSSTSEVCAGGISGLNVYFLKDSISTIKFEISGTDEKYIGAMIGTLAHGTYSEEVLAQLFEGNIYLWKENLFGICGYYDSADNHFRYGEDLKGFTCYDSEEEIKGAEIYW